MPVVYSDLRGAPARLPAARTADHTLRSGELVHGAVPALPAPETAAWQTTATSSSGVAVHR
jgi:hypothetical protein